MSIPASASRPPSARTHVGVTSEERKQVPVRALLALEEGLELGRSGRRVRVERLLAACKERADNALGLGLAVGVVDREDEQVVGVVGRVVDLLDDLVQLVRVVRVVRGRLGRVLEDLLDRGLGGGG